MPLPTLEHATVYPGEAYAFQAIPGVDVCHIIHVDYKVEQFSLSLKLEDGTWISWHNVRVDPLGTREERESEIRRILGWNNDHVLPFTNAFGCEVVVLIGGRHPNIDYDIRTLVGMVEVDIIVVVESPDSMESHRQYLRDLGFTRQNQVEGHHTGYVWVLEKGIGNIVDINTFQNDEVKLTVTRRCYDAYIRTMDSGL